MGNEQVEPLAVGLKGAAERIGISVSQTHRLVIDGTIPARRLGRRILISVDVLREFIASLPVYTSADASADADLETV